MRTMLGVVVTPPVILMVSWFLTPLLLKWGIFWDVFPDRPMANVPTSEMVRDFFFGLRMKYVQVLLPGIPGLLLLRWLRIRSWYGYALAGLVMGAGFAYAGEILFAFSDSGTPFTFANLIKMIVRLPVDEARGTQLFVAPAAVYGPLTALVFWVIARPDLSRRARAPQHTP
jgi:hypothetical protein